MPIIWIIGQYADRIENSDELLEDFVFTFLEEPVEVQLALLTATIKLFLKRPTAGAELVPKILKWATEQVDNPDLRDRGFIYWRLLSTNPAAAKNIVMADKPSISTESESLDPAVLDRLLLQTGTLSSVYHRSPEIFIRHTKPKYLSDSPALNPAAKKSYQESIEIAARRPPPVPETMTAPKPMAPAPVTRKSTTNEDSPMHSTAEPTPSSPHNQLPHEMEGAADQEVYRTGSLDVDEHPVVDQDDPYAALSSLDPSGFFGHQQDNYQTDEPRPLSGMMHHTGNYSLI